MSRQTSLNPLLRSWNRARRLPGGRSLFTRLLRRRVPYSGTIRARVDELAPGYAKVRMEDHRRVRNHLNSIHAIALANLGELTTGLAMSAAIPAGMRGIPVRLSIEFLKKARGEISAESQCSVPQADEEREHEVEALLKDPEGEPVARFKARWLVGPTD